MSGFSFFITIFLCSIADTNASGIIELLISSPQSVLIKSTACASFKCPVHDELSVPRNVEGGVPLRIHIGQYRGEARQNIDLHFEILEPSTNGRLHKLLYKTSKNPFSLRNARPRATSCSIRHKMEHRVAYRHRDHSGLQRDCSSAECVHLVSIFLTEIVSKCKEFYRNYYGKRCNRYCIPSPALHWECSTNGVRQCAVGWYGDDCSSSK